MATNEIAIPHLLMTEKRSLNNKAEPALANSTTPMLLIGKITELWSEEWLKVKIKK